MLKQVISAMIGKVTAKSKGVKPWISETDNDYKKGDGI